MRLAILVSFLNEAELMPTFLASMQRQTRPPDVLVLVDDGSMDGSGEIAEGFAVDHDYARVVHRPPRPCERDRLAFAAELRAFHWGAAQLEDEWDVIAKMDADLDLAPRHIEAVMAALEGDDRLGVAGAYLAAVDPKGVLRREWNPADHVRGPNKFYRRACFEQIKPLPEHLGWDTIDDIRARLHGWKTLSVAVPGGDSLHMRPTGAHDGRLRAYRRWGLCAWGWGSHPLYALMSAGYRVRDRPYGIAGLNFFWGYVEGALRGAPRVDGQTKAFARREERARIRRVIRSGLRRVD